MRFWKNASLTGKFLMLVVPLLLVITFAGFAAFDRQFRHDARADLLSRMDSVATVQASSLAAPAWVLDREQIALVLSAMLNDPDIRGVAVLDERGVPLAEAGTMKIADETLSLIERPVIYVDALSNNARTIGTLRIAYSEARLRSEARDRLRSTILLGSFASMIAIGGALIGLRGSVIRPLALFLDRIRQAKDADAHLAVDWDRKDEIGTLVAAYNDLQRSQRTYQAELEGMRSDLEKRVEARTRDLEDRQAELLRAKDAAEAALSDLRSTQARLVESEKLASLGQLTAGIAHEIKNPLNFVNNFATLSRTLLHDLLDEIRPLLDSASADDRASIEELGQMLDGNLEKIGSHGVRADSIIKNMLAHSRQGPETPMQVDPNRLAREALDLVYHAMRAEFPGFNITTNLELAAGLPSCTWYAQELQRAIMNVLLNAMQATDKRYRRDGTPGEPTIRLATRLTDAGKIEIQIEDNGPGIPPSLMSEIFKPFFTTKPAGEGTGLGLSMAYDIIVHRHDGTLDVSSEPGSYTRFTMVLPVTVVNDNVR